MFLRRLPIKTRVAFFFALVNSALLCLFSVSVFAFYAESVQSDVENSVQSEFDRIFDRSLAYLSPLDHTGLREFLVQESIALSERGFAVFVSDASSGGGVTLGNFPGSLEGVSRGAVSISIRNEPYLFYASSVGPFRFAVGVNEWSHVTSKIVLLSRILIFFVLLGSLLGFFVSKIIAEMVLSPLRRLAQEVDELKPDSDEKLESVALKYPNDELRRLAQAFDRFSLRIRRFVDREKEFVSDVGHELRTPLTVIQTSAELLQAKSRDEWANSKIQLILDASDRMNRMTNELLELSRESARAPVRNPVSVEAFARSLAARLKPFAETKGVTLSFSGEDFSIEASESDLEKVLSNLIKNAVVHSGSKRVECLFRSREFSIQDF